MNRRILPMIAFACAIIGGAHPSAPAQEAPGDTVQAQVVLTVSESKRLIARAVVEMPMVKRALEDGVLILAKGTTNTYIAEELTGKPVPHGAYVYGRTYPAQGGKTLPEVEAMSEVTIVRGEVQEDWALADAVKQLRPGDVVIKGANALDYENKTAGVLIGSKTGGTSGTIMPYVVARKAHLIIPVGLEKQIAGQVLDTQLKLREPMESLNDIPSMFLLTGHVVTEIEALQILTGVDAFQAAAGGIGGAEGSVRLVCRGTREQVRKALDLVQSIQGEPPFVK